MARARKGVATALLISVPIITVTAVASADPIRITSGTVEVTGFGPATSIGPTPVHLAGDRGFTLDAIGGSGSFGPAVDCDPGCVAGQDVSLDMMLGGLDLNGTAALDGTSWSHIGGASDDATALVSFSSVVSLPSTIGDAILLSAPFSLSGSFIHGWTGTDVISETLVGKGTVTTTFERAVIVGPGFYRPRSTVYTFSNVVPEPGSFVLTATGLVAGLRAAMARRRKARGRG